MCISGLVNSFSNLDFTIKKKIFWDQMLKSVFTFLKLFFTESLSQGQKRSEKAYQGLQDLTLL